MPNRILRDGIITSRAVNALSESAEIFYRRLMSVVDDYGRFEADADILRARLFPIQLETWPVSRVEQMLSECVADAQQVISDATQVPLIRVYVVDGRKYLELSNFRQQTRSRSKYPEPTAMQVLSNCLADAQQLRTKTESYSESYAETKAEAAPVGANPPHLSSDEAAAMLSRQPRTPLQMKRPEPEDDHRISEWFEERMQAHPNKRDAMLAQRMLSELKDAHDPAWRADFTRVHTLWCESETWTWKQGAKCPTLAQWISDKGWRWPPPRDSTPACAPKVDRVLELAKENRARRIAEGELRG